MAAPNSNATPAEPRQRPPRRRRALRVLFRWTGLFLLFLVLVVLGAAWWSNHHGLPDFAKRQLLAQLRQAGWEVEFSRLRWGWREGIVAENLQLSRPNGAPGPEVYIESARCLLSPDALKSLRLQVNAVSLSGGRLIYALPEASKRAPLWMNDVQGHVRFASPELWQLTNFQATIQGIRLRLDGAVTNASVIRDWKLPEQPKEPKRARKGSPFWHRMVQTVHAINFKQSPTVNGQFYLDAQNLTASEADLKIDVPEFASPWGKGRNVTLHARLQPPTNPEAETRMTVDFTAAQAHTPWASARGVRIESVLEPTLTRWLPTNSTIRIQAQAAETPWVRATHLSVLQTLSACPTNDTYAETHLSVEMDQLRQDRNAADHARVAITLWHPATNWAPAMFEGSVHLAKPVMPQVRSREAELKFSGSLPDRERLQLFYTNQPWADRLTGIELAGTTRFRDAVAGQFLVPELHLTSHWTSNQWHLGVGGLMADGALTARAMFNPGTRHSTFNISSSVDPQWFVPLLSTNLQRVFTDITYQRPPQLEATGQWIAPAATLSAPEWRAAAQAGLQVAGHFQIGQCGYRGVPLEELQLPFTWTNQYLHVPAFVLSRPEGKIEANFTTDAQSGKWEARLRSQVLPSAIEPLLTTKGAREGIGFARFTSPPVLTAEAQGQWADLDKLTASGHLSATNFTLRNESIGRLDTDVRFTNRVIYCVNPVAQRTNEQGSAPLVTIDLRQLKIYLTNAVGNLDPYVVTRIIGPKTAKAIVSYQFEQPPQMQLEGVIDLKKKSYDDDLLFTVNGGRFHWEVFHCDAMRGNVRLQGKMVTLTNVVGSLHGGEVLGHARFDTAPTNRTDFAFELKAEQLNFNTLMRDLSPKAKTNRLEGTLGGTLQIIYANTHDLKSWQGHGNVRLRDGLIWDIPAFGILSPVLNTFAPGMGNSRARDGTATFVITNSVIFSKDLQIHASAMRMQFEGTVDFTPELNARVEAELLRDLPGVGFLVSKIFWPVTKLFEFRLTGPLGDPKLQPVYLIPRIILLPFHPLRALKDLVTPGESDGDTPDQKPTQSPKDRDQ